MNESSRASVILDLEVATFKNLSKISFLNFNKQVQYRASTC